MDMDNHPIPQDVSHFQFKLIGEMTLKQFGYLGAGMAMAWLFFSLPVSFLVRIPLALIYAGSGIILAFVPIEGRPADTMIKNFAKALFAPNQYIFRKESADPALSALLMDNRIPVTPVVQQTVKPEPVDQPGMETYITSLPETSPQGNETTLPPLREYVQMQGSPTQGVSQPSQPIPQQTVTTPQPVQQFTQQGTVTPQAGSPEPSEQEVTKEQQELNQEADSLTQALQQAKSNEQQQQQGSPAYEQAHQKVIELEEQLQKFAAQKQQLEQELLSLKQKLANQEQSRVYTAGVATQPPPPESTHVHQIPKPMGNSVGIPHVPDFPNLITGIVKDSRGNVLPNILIEVKDAEGNPVRAFKTNQLGQFASATPLLNGTYTVFFEDPGGKHRFDTIEITANGDILLPIEVISIDQREELRKELFG